MNGSLRVGRLLFAIAMVFFGVGFFIFVTSMSGPPPGPPWSRGVLSLDWLACIGFLLAGVSIATGMMGRLVAMLLGVVLLLYVVSRYMAELLAHLHDPGLWTVVFEILALVGGAWVLAAGFPPDKAVAYPRQLCVATGKHRAIPNCYFTGGVRSAAFYVCGFCCDADSGVDSGAIVLDLLYRHRVYRRGYQYC
jgi:hypothetical protein